MTSSAALPTERQWTAATRSTAAAGTTTSSAASATTRSAAATATTFWTATTSTSRAKGLRRTRTRTATAATAVTARTISSSARPPRSREPGTRSLYGDLVPLVERHHDPRDRSVGDR